MKIAFLSDHRLVSLFPAGSLLLSWANSVNLWCAVFWNNRRILGSWLYSLGRFLRAGYHHKWRTRCVIYWEYSPIFYRNRISIECKRVHPNMYLLISTYMQPHIYVPTYIYLHATPRPPSCMKSKIFPIPLECCGGVGECPRISPFLAQAQMLPAAWPTHAFIKIMKTFSPMCVCV